MKILLIIPCLLLQVFSTEAATPAWDPGYDPTNKWDWTNQAWWLATNYFPDPFHDPHATIGIDISQDGACLSTDGWVLYQRRLYQGDVGPDFGTSPDINTILNPNDFSSLNKYGARQDRAFFCLYNIYTGILRFFLYRPAFSISNPAQCIRTSIFIKMGASTWLQHGVFNSYSGRTQESAGKSLSQSEASIVQLSDQVANSAWLVVDVRPDYDPLLKYDQTDGQTTTSIPNLTIQIINDLISIQNLSMQISGTSVSKNVIIAPDNTLSSTLQTAWTKRGQIHKTASSSVEGITNLKNDLKSMGFTEMAGAVGQLTSYANPIGAVIGTVSILGGLFNLGSGKKTEVSYDTAVINLTADGTISTVVQDPSGNFEVGLAGSRFSQSGAIPYFSKVNGRDKKLGLFCLRFNPKVQDNYESKYYAIGDNIKYQYQEIFPNLVDPISCILLNPFLGGKLELKESKYSYMIKGRFTEAYAGADKLSSMPVAEARIISQSSDPSQTYPKNVTIVSDNMYPFEYFTQRHRFMIIGYGEYDSYVNMYTLFEYKDPAIRAVVPFIECSQAYQTTPFATPVNRTLDRVTYNATANNNFNATNDVAIYGCAFQNGSKITLLAGRSITIKVSPYNNIPTVISIGASFSASLHSWADDPLAKLSMQRSEDSTINNAMAQSDSSDYSKFEVFENHPNPFNPSTTISYRLPKNLTRIGNNVTIIILNSQGKIVKHLSDHTYRPVGLKFAKWDGLSDNNMPLPSGLYLCSLVTGEYKKTIKMLKVK